MRSSFRAAAIICLIMAADPLFHPSLQGQERKTSAKLATVDGFAITESQVRKESANDLDSLELERLRTKATQARNENEILERTLNRLIEERLLQIEAVKRGVTKEELVSKEILQHVQEPTEKEIDDFYEENKENISESKKQVSPKIARYLKKQRENDLREALLQKLKKEHRVIRSFKPIRFDVNAPGRPTRGPASAPVVLVVFSDFECPYCRDFSMTLSDIIDQFGDKVRLVFRQYPLTRIHPDAQKAAEASLCAAAQNRFWEMHDLLFANQDKLQEEDIKSRAKDLNLNADAFNSCLTAKRVATLIREDIRAGSAAGADGTPTLYVNGRYLGGSHTYEEIAAVIEEELHR